MVYHMINDYYKHGIHLLDLPKFQFVVLIGLKMDHIFDFTVII